MRMGKCAAMVACMLMTTGHADAEWAPQWSTAWSHPTEVHGTGAVDVDVAADGGVFAAVETSYSGTAHATLLHFDAQGGFVWMREWAGANLAAVHDLGDGRVLSVGSAQGGSVFVRVVDGDSGDLVWEHVADGFRLGFDQRFGMRYFALSASGDVLVRASEGSDLVVLRYTQDGEALPEWRWDSGAESAAANSIIATPDGGAVVSGQGDTIDDGYRTVRFDASGEVVYEDLEPGDLGNPLGAAWLADAGDGGVLVAASPESSFGVPRAQVWKLAANGDRLWTQRVPDDGSTTTDATIGGFVATANGDALIVIDSVSEPRFHLLRLDGASGDVTGDVTSEIGGTPSVLALAANGRALVGGFAFIDSSGHVAGRVAEFDAAGRVCRETTDLSMYSGVAAAAREGGWTLLGSGLQEQGSGSAAIVRRYDAQGACDGDEAIFADGFESVENAAATVRAASGRSSRRTRRPASDR